MPPTLHALARTRSSIALLAQLILLSCGLLAVTPSAATGETLTYTLTEEWTEGNSGGTSLEVRQQGAVTTASFEGSDGLALVSDPDNGVLGAWVEERPPVFVHLVETPAELAVGDAIAMATASAARLDAFEFDLERGENDMTIEGRSARHDILRIEVEWSGTDTNGRPISGRSSGSADLWTVEELPHSWLPYVAPKGFAMAAVPLSFHHPDVAVFVLGELGDELKALGLLVRAEARSHSVHESGGGEMEQSFVREVGVEGLEVVADGAEVSIPDRPALTQTRYVAFKGLMFVGQDACVAEAESSRLHLESGMSGEGVARLQRDEKSDPRTSLVLGSLRPGPDGPGSGCLVVLAPDSLVEGSLPVSIERPSHSGGASEGSRAAAYHMAGDQQEIRMTILEAGQLDLQKEEDGWKASLEGTAWSLTLKRSGGATLQDQVPVDVTFTFDGENPPEKPAG